MSTDPRDPESGNPFRSALARSLVDVVLGLSAVTDVAAVPGLLAEAGYDAPLLDELIREGLFDTLSLLLPLAPPTDPDARAAWQERLDTLARGAEVACAIDTAWAAPLALALGLHVTEARAAGASAPVHAPSPRSLVDDLNDWFEGRLGAPDNAQLARLVRSDVDVRALYVELLSQRLSLVLPRWPPGTATVLDPLVAEIKVPHSEESVRVISNSAGVTWRFAGGCAIGPNPTLRLDDIEVQARVDRPEASLADALEELAARVADEALSEPAPGAPPSAVWPALAVLGGKLVEQSLAACSDAQRRGLDLPAHSEETTAAVWALRELLDEVAARSPAPELLQALASVDFLLERHVEALDALPDDIWQRLSGDPPGTMVRQWPGDPEARVEQFVRDVIQPKGDRSSNVTAKPGPHRLAADTQRRIEPALEELGATEEDLHPRWIAGIRFVDLAVSRKQLGLACELERELAPRAGEAAGVAYRRGGSGGVLFVVRVTRDDSAVGPVVAARYGEVAERAIRTAWRVAGALCPNKLAPFPWHGHRVHVDIPAAAGSVGDEGEAEIDGGSLGVAAALAFLSSWTGVPLPREHVYSAAIGEDGALWPVEGLERKAAVVEACGVDPTPVLVVAARQPGIDSPVPLLRAASVEHAAQLAGLGDAVSRIVGTRPSVDALLGRVDTLTRAFEAQRLDDHDGLRWLDIADGLAWALGMLRDERGSRVRAVLEKFPNAALAYSYAGVMPATRVYEPSSELVSQLRPFARTWDAIVRLACVLPTDDWAECDSLAARLRAEDDALRASDVSGWEKIHGMALGTLGRLELHRREHRDLARSIALLEEGVAHHLLHEEREVPRSRCYLANALRLAGRLVDAHAQLEAARRDVAALREREPFYARSTTMFVAYEWGRLRLSEGEPAAALAELDEASRISSQLAAWAPRGLPRARAQALRAIGRRDEADEIARQMPDDCPFARRLRDEAAGIPVEPPEPF